MNADTNTIADLPETNPNAIHAAPEPSWIVAVEPWTEPVVGAALLAELSALMTRFVVLPKAADVALALWTVHTYAFHLRDVSTYVGIESPEKRCGKTTLLGVLSELVNRPVVAANISSPAFFRVIEETQPTLLIDEADTFLQGNDELRGILNSGYSRKTAYVVRVANQFTNDDLRYTSGGLAGSKVQESKVQSRGYAMSRDETLRADSRQLKPAEAGDPQRAGAAVEWARGFGGHGREWGGAKGQSRLARFSCWCPKIMAAIGRLPETLADRCIVIRMQRKTAKEECERLRQLETAKLRRQCARFVQDHASAIAAARPPIPASLNDRAADIWEPLLVLADLAGGPWPELARHAAETLTFGVQDQSPISALLLDIAYLFTSLKSDRIFSRTMVEELNGMGDRPWNELNRGKEITELWLAQRLRPYGVRPRTMRIGEERAKGYSFEDFEQVFPRYVRKADFEAWKEEAGTVETKE